MLNLFLNILYVVCYHYRYFLSVGMLCFSFYYVVKEEMLKKIQEAKGNGLTLKLSYTTVALTGSSASGKTSFLNLLSRQKFTAHHHSTNVAKSKQVVYTAGVV